MDSIIGRAALDFCTVPLRACFLWNACSRLVAEAATTEEGFSYGNNDVDVTHRLSGRVVKYTVTSHVSEMPV